MPNLPASDWQFWVVTLVAATGLVALVRPFLPSRSRTSTSPACPHCPSGGETCQKATALPAQERVVKLGRG